MLVGIVFLVFLYIYIYIHEAILPQLCYYDDYVFFISVYEKRYVPFFFHFLLLSGSLSVRSRQTFRLRISGHNSDVADNFSRRVEVYALGRRLTALVECTKATDMTVKGSCVLADFQALEALMPL